MQSTDRIRFVSRFQYGSVLVANLNVILTPFVWRRYVKILRVCNLQACSFMSDLLDLILDLTVSRIELLTIK